MEHAKDIGLIWGYIGVEALDNSKPPRYDPIIGM